jgi:hypothetical protein
MAGAEHRLADCVSLCFFVQRLCGDVQRTRVVFGPDSLLKETPSEPGQITQNPRRKKRSISSRLAGTYTVVPPFAEVNLDHVICFD